MNGTEVINSGLIFLAAVLPLTLAGQDVSKGETAGFYEVEGIRIPVHVVTIKEEGEEKASEKGNTPPSKGSRYVLQTTGGNFVIGYSRFLNRTPEWQGKHGASVGFDMGLGFPGFGTNWYGNTLRVKIDGDDVIGRLAADKIEWKSGPGVGRWRAFWTTEKGSLAVTVVVLDGVGAGLLEITCDGPATAIELELYCFPGGYGPAYGTPSIRSVSAGRESVQVAIGEGNKTFTIPAEADGIFYCDRWPESQKIAGSGSCGLVFLSEQIGTKTVLMSNYGQTTTLKLRPGIKSAVLALTEYPLPNATAEERFPAEQARLRELLKSTEFWTKEK